MADIYFTEEQLKSLSIESLVSMVMVLQNNQIEQKRAIDQLTEQIRLMNQRQYGRKTEQKSSLYEQLQLDIAFNETEVTADEKTESEPEIEKVVVRKRPKGKKEDSLKKIINRREEYITLSETELKAKVWQNGDLSDWEESLYCFSGYSTSFAELHRLLSNFAAQDLEFTLILDGWDFLQPEQGSQVELSAEKQQK